MRLWNFIFSKKVLQKNRNESLSLFLFGTLFVVAFLLNWFWEVSQTVAFDMRGVGTGKMLLFCTLAAIVDAIITVIVFWSLQKLFRRRDWKFYVSAAAFGAIFAILFEQIAFIFGLWSYDQKMPVLPFLGTGLLPFLQLTILIPTAIWVTLKYRTT